MQDAVYRWSVPGLSKPYWDALRNECWPRQTATLTCRDRGVTTLSAYPQTKPHKHQGGAKQPHYRKCDSGPASRDGVREVADDAQRCGPRKVGRPKLVEDCAYGQNEIERGATQIQYLVVALPPGMDVRAHAASPTTEAYKR